MSKPLPKCHYCKKSLARKPRILFDFHGDVFGWHTENDYACTRLDPDFEIACGVFSGRVLESEGVCLLQKIAHRPKRTYMKEV